jgi:hypothetical protein
MKNFLADRIRLNSANLREGTIFNTYDINNINPLPIYKIYTEV